MKTLAAGGCRSQKRAVARVEAPAPYARAMSVTTDTMTAGSREESKQRTRDLLLGAGREVFLKAGYQGAKLDDIAAAAGFTKGALYWHFPNKQALFLALIADSIAADLGTLDSFLALGAADPAALKARLADWIDGIDERETLPAFGVELEIEIESRRDSKFRAVHQQMIAGHEAALTKFLTQYFQLVGETPAIPDEALASSLITILKGFALARQNRAEPPVSSAATVRLLMGLAPGEQA